MSSNINSKLFEKAKPDFLDFDRDGNKRESMKKSLKDKSKKKMTEARKQNTKFWWDDDGDGIGYEKGEVFGKFKKKKKVTKESYSNWREELSEVVEFISKDKNGQKITEKKVNNKIKINPNIGEAVENLGGTLIEMVEIDELDCIVESVYDELLDEGYEEDDIVEALEYALTEATVTYGHDTDKPYQHQKKSGTGRLIKAVGRLARQKLSSKVNSAKSAVRRSVSSGARKVASAATKIADRADSEEKHAKRNTVKGHENIMRNNHEYQTAGKSSGGYRNKGVGRREKVSSGSYTGPAKKKAEPVKDPWEGSATTPPKAKKAAAKPKATTKTAKVTSKKKKSDPLDDLLSSIRNEQVQIDEKILSAAETKKKEELVKSMKKKASDFEKRYPGRGKEVMYATATKMAKKMAEQAMELQPKTQQQSKSQTSQQDKKIAQQKDRQRQQEIQILNRKLQALRSAPKGSDTDITA